jgi:hypothetical protein
MRHTIKTLALSSLVSALLLAPQPAAAEGTSATQHMGPTGITALIGGERAFNVKAVDEGSPADGKVWPGDQVVGAGKMPFLKRVRFEFAAAIAEARTEKNKGQLVLMVRRKDGGRKLQRVTLQLDAVGPDTFNDTAPYNCPKTDALIKEAADFIVSGKARSPYGRLQIGLLGLLATGEDKYIQHVRDHLHEVEWAKPDGPLGGGYVSWYWGYKNLILTEYFLLTGDEYVLPAIRRHTEAIAQGQDAAGIWGHRMHDPKTGRAPGYGAMNQPTMPLYISLILAKKCGVDSPRISEAIERTTNHYIDNYLQKGALPYGNGGANSKGYNNNGSSAALAIALAAAGHTEGAKFFSRMAMAGYGDLESGHATHFFNLMWTGLGANIAGPDAMAAYFKKTSWIFPMKVDWEGGYTYEVEGGEGLGNTGAYLLNLCAGRRKIHTTGKGVDPAVSLNAQEIEETLGVHKYLNELIPMGIDELLVVAETHWSPKVRGVAAWKLLKFKREEIEASVRKRLTKQKNADALIGVSRLWDSSPQIFDEVAAILRDKNADLDARVAAAGVLGGAAWARYVEPEEDFGKADFYEGGELHKPALKYFPDLVQAIADEEPNDPTGKLDRAAGASLASLGDPYTQKLITEKEVFYKAVNKMLADKHSAGNRTAGMGLIAANMPLEDFHYVADMVVHAAIGTDPTYTVYRGGSNTTEIGVGLLNRLNIQEAVEVCLDSFPTATRGKERARRLALFTSFGANAKPYLPRLRAALENDLKPDPNAEEDEGFTKDVSLNKAEIEKVMQEIEAATNPRKMISIEEAIAAGKK